MMKRIVILLCVLAITLALGVSASFAAKPVTYYTLTVASSNPASGVAITVSPNDRDGLGNGTTQFVRTYLKNAVVTLTAPATAGGNNFVKWQKGAADYATTPGTTVTMTANTTMTAVYASGSVHSTLTWTGYTMCQSCHMAQVTDMFNSVHYQWQGSGAEMVNGGAVQGKIGAAMNAFCINVLGNFGACGSCHMGLGAAPSANQSQAQLDNIDCLLCHQKDYKRKKVAGLFEPDTANMTITMDVAVRTIHKPVKANCLQCHAKAGGGDAVKRGDIALASGTTADINYDRHMATSGANLVCQQCHAFTNHKVSGRGSDLRPLDSTVAIGCSSAACHPTKTSPTGHTTTQINRHTARVACQSCHIPVYGKNASDTVNTEATETSRDWRTSEWNAVLGRWEPIMTKANNLIPVYKFFNGTSWGYNLQDAVTIENGKYAVSRPQGSISDATTASKLTPFKYKTAWQPVTTGQNPNKLIAVSTQSYFSLGNYDTAVTAGLTNMGLSSSIPYATIQADEYLMLNHQVAPSTAALTCTSCHTTSATQMQLLGAGGLGYDLKGPSTVVCAQCHNPRNVKPYESMHNHVNTKGFDCSWCHNFSRPERGLTMP